MLGIIIPTKDNTKELFECLQSIKKATSIQYHIYVADTGSNTNIKIYTKKLLTNMFADNSTFIEYDYYNFGKINNDVVRNYIDDDIDVLLFCNNDIKIGVVGLVDAMHDLIISESNTIGTCGCRLLYPDKTIQHDGQFFRRRSYNNYNYNYNYVMGHNNLGIPSSLVTSPNPVIVNGITFGFAMTMRSTFEAVGMLSEDYLVCFEDVQYNLECMNNGLVNMLLPSRYWAYHYESTTRANNTNETLTPDLLTINKYINTSYNGEIKY